MTQTMTKHQGGTALALPTQPIDKLEDLARTFEQLQGRALILSPIAQIDHLMPMHQVSLRAVMIDPSVDEKGSGPECYFDSRFCKPGEVALGKNALTKIMGAAGVQIAQRTRLDDRSDPNYCEVEVTLAIRDFDGQYRQVIATKEMDLRPGAPETMKPEWDDRSKKKTGRMVAMEDTALADKRRHIQSHAETKAIERGLRLLFSLRQKYSRDDLAKPFVIPKLVSNLDPNDPETKTALIQHALHGEAALFGARQEPARTMREATPPPKQVGRGDAMPDQEHQRETSGPGRETPDSSPAREDEGQGSFDLLDFAAETESKALIFCLCPCGDQAVISEEIARVTTEKVGAPRCQSCYPGRDFDFGKHRDLPRDGDLRLPKLPGLTAERVKTANEKAAAKK